ncbi:MAG TPA: cyclic nucleotide-binding domain-containing protein [Candidatus Hydrogenedens sp.]|nr:cyclic nucleotide-binding domain-containing protein [Candidatus Hydrogenedens sp.]
MNKKEIEQQIVNSHLFQGLNIEEIRKLIEQGLVVHFQKDEVVFYQGSIGSRVYLIIQGGVGIYQEEKEIVQLGEGEIFGEMALLTKQPRSATAKAIKDSSFLVFSETSFEKLLTKKTAVRLLLNIINILCERLRNINQSIRT